MHIEYVGRGYHVGDADRELAEQKLRKVVKFLDEPVEGRVTLKTEKHRQIADLHLSHRHGILQASEEAGDMRDAINLAADKLAKQAAGGRKRFMDRRRRADRVEENGQHWPVEVLARESLGSGTPRVIESTRLPIKPMTVEEAAQALEGSAHGFVVFRDAARDRLSVLYRREDDNYGLIAPEL